LIEPPKNSLDTFDLLTLSGAERPDKKFGKDLEAALRGLLVIGIGIGGTTGR